jgi:H+/Cl- antiporter ClcA
MVMSTHERTPHWRVLLNELKLGRHWLDRAVVLAFAVLTGGVVVCFTLLAETCMDLFMELLHSGRSGAVLTLFWTPALTVAVLAWTRRFAPEASGSGIPQVMAAIHEGTEPQQVSRLVSLRVGLQKVVLTSAGLLAGLSIGREGPTVQVGAAVMRRARWLLSAESGLDEHDLMVAGAAAGIAAAFNTPLGGVVFAIEKLSRRRNLTHSNMTITAIVLAGLVAISAFGNHSYFGALVVPTLKWSLLGPGLLVALLSGLVGGLFGRLTVACAYGRTDRVSLWRAQFPLRFALICGTGVALINFITDGATAGAGYHPTRALLEQGEDGLPPLYTLLKFVATWLSSWSGVPAGVFAPSLAIGAGLGHDVAVLTGLSGQPMSVALVALGMVGFLAASTQGPITAFIIVMEMISGGAMVLSLMSCALLASAIGRLVSAPMYTELAYLWGMPRAPQPAPKPVPVAPAPLQPPQSG